MTTARIWAAAATIAPIFVPAIAQAQGQLDVNPPPPDVLLLIDNSGSMERMIDGTLPESTPANNCNCDAVTGVCNWAAQPPPNRWGVMLQALTGTFQNGYNCAAMPRTAGSVFDTEYKINGVSPYDVNPPYYLPFHRPIFEDTVTKPGTNLACVYAPGTLPGAAAGSGVGPAGAGAGGKATDFPANAIAQHTYGTAGTKACGGANPLQYGDGAIDSELDVLRFGLMTFDQDPDPSTGMTGGGTVTSPNAFTGMWSYFPSWGTGGTLSCPASPAPFSYCGMPANCSTPTLMAVGARNPAAPPWEGRMMPFPSATDIPSQEVQNLNVQQVLLASRPFGATPLAGMFAGAQYYMQTDPTGPQQSDTFIKQGCRAENIILLTDGAPNLDMEPSCRASGAPNGVCPFQLPETTAATLATAPLPVTTYVIGFAVSSFNDQGTTIYCSNLVNNGTLAAACTNPTPLYAPCCELQRIAVAGGTSRAYFADSPADLQKALASILGQITKNTTTRTVPAYSSVITNASANPNTPRTNASLFLASFIPSPGLPWSGNVQRQRYVCAPGMGSTYVVNAPPPDKNVGDDFAANLNSNSTPRTFIMFQPDPLGAGVDATATIRPYVAANVGDGLGKYSAATVAGTATNVLPKITPAALALTNTQCTYTPQGSAVLKGGVTKTLTSGGCPLCLCRDMLLDFTFGQPFSGNPGDFPFVTRVGNAFGDVFHATPAIVGPPGSLLRDDSYIGFASVNASGYGSRKQIAYVATNDGLLHAFWADETLLENNELWAMMPPAVMPNLATSYPASHQLLLDGSPVVKDVVWDRPAAKQGDPTTWHTMLVAGFGPTQRGYYAVDVTNPNPAGIGSGPAVPADPPPTGPVFMWQLTNMPGTNAPLFGTHAATPAITSVFVDPGDGKGTREIGVAILPGGQDSPPTSSAASGPSCNRAPKPAGNAAPFTGNAARAAVRCWGKPQNWTDPVVGRSLSIVRLDTGEILRVFMRAGDITGNYPSDTLYAKSRITDTPLDSPMTGVPIVYPTDVGTDATRVFVGDADGTMWRFDLSNPDPSKWVGELYLDLYNNDAKTPPPTWSDGQPVQLAPVISLDPAGNVVLNVATGTQETFDSTGVYYVYSISEMVDMVHAPAKLRAQVNWWLDPATVTTSAGERVSGPMTVFDGALYFATYAAAAAGTQACKSGHGRIWGLDFLQPVDSAARKLGGVPRLVPAPTGHAQYIQPDDPVTGDPSLAGVVIPGVSIKASPACAGLGNPTTDAYVAGATHQTPANFSPGQFSVFTQLGTKGTGTQATKQFELQVPTPVAPTVIDSWAAVLE